MKRLKAEMATYSRDSTLRRLRDARLSSSARITIPDGNHGAVYAETNIFDYYHGDDGGDSIVEPMSSRRSRLVDVEHFFVDFLFFLSAGSRAESDIMMRTSPTKAAGDGLCTSCAEIETKMLGALMIENGQWTEKGDLAKMIVVWEREKNNDLILCKCP